MWAGGLAARRSPTRACKSRSASCSAFCSASSSIAAITLGKHDVFSPCWGYLALRKPTVRRTDTMTKTLFLAGVLVLGWGMAARADWLAFRGPGHQGHASAGDFPARWSAEDNVAWKVKLPGLGAS